MDIGFRTPVAALVVLVVLVPLTAAVIVDRRAARARRQLRLAEPSLRSRIVAPLAVCVLAALVGVAVARPVVRDTRTRLVRTDAEVMFAMDISRSMTARASPKSGSRMARSKALAKLLRARFTDVRVGVASFTDRSLPHLFPSVNLNSFALSIDRAIGIDRPPPRTTGVSGTAFAALADVPLLYFSREARRRVVLVLTDGESRPFDRSVVHDAFAKTGVTGIVIRVGNDRERVFNADGSPDPAYRPGGAERAIRTLVAATGGSAFAESDLRGISRALRDALGEGESKPLGRAPSSRELAPLFVLGALAPLAIVLWRRNSP